MNCTPVPTCSSGNYGCPHGLPPINADTLLAAARQHERHLRALPPRDYEMRVFENGSVYFRNTEIPGLEKLFSLAEIQKASCDFWMSPARPLWKHVLATWE